MSAFLYVNSTILFFSCEKQFTEKRRSNEDKTSRKFLKYLIVFAQKYCYSIYFPVIEGGATSGLLPQDLFGFAPIFKISFPPFTTVS